MGEVGSKSGAFGRPVAGEHNEYYSRYIEQVPDGDIFAMLEEQAADTAALLRSVPVDRETYRYAPDKWSIREVMGHVIDTERVFGYRCVHFARGDAAPLPSMEQEDWARAANAHARPLHDLAAEFMAVRRGHVLFLRGLDPTLAMRRGVASGFEFTVRSLPWIIAGHELHHVRLLRERYGGAFTP